MEANWTVRVGTISSRTGCGDDCPAESECGRWAYDGDVSQALEDYLVIRFGDQLSTLFLFPLPLIVPILPLLQGYLCILVTIFLIGDVFRVFVRGFYLLAMYGVTGDRCNRLHYHSKWRLDEGTWSNSASQLGVRCQEIPCHESNNDISSQR